MDFEFRLFCQVLFPTPRITRWGERKPTQKRIQHKLRKKVNIYSSMIIDRVSITTKIRCCRHYCISVTTPGWSRTCADHWRCSITGIRCIHATVSQFLMEYSSFHILRGYGVYSNTWMGYFKNPIINGLFKCMQTDLYGQKLQHTQVSRPWNERRSWYTPVSVVIKRESVSLMVPTFPSLHIKVNKKTSRVIFSCDVPVTNTVL